MRAGFRGRGHHIHACHRDAAWDLIIVLSEVTLQPINHRRSFEPRTDAWPAEVMNSLAEDARAHLIAHSLRLYAKALSKFRDGEVLFGGHNCFYNMAISGDHGFYCCLRNLTTHANYGSKLQCIIH